MIDEDEVPRHANRERDDLLLVYDFFRHLTTLSLITIGGVLSLAQAGGMDLRRGATLVAVGAISLAGGLSLLFQGNLVSTELLGRSVARKRRTLAAIQQMTLLTYLLGVGLFVGGFTAAAGRNADPRLAVEGAAR